MRVLITGATGFIGRALVLRLRRDGHEPVAFVRSLQRGHNLLGQECRCVAAQGSRAEQLAQLGAALAGCEAVINLAGENIMKGRWSARRKQALLRSRVDTTELLVEAIRTAAVRPKVLVSASAIGYYGSGNPCHESSPPGQDFLAQVCVAWEAAAAPVRALGVRLVQPRIGVVLGHEGGVLGTVLPLFMAGLGAQLGNGKQLMPWIHLHDLVDSLVQALTRPAFDGPYNAVAPQPADNATFTAALAEALGRRARLALPAPLLRLALGEAAITALGSIAAQPQTLSAWGFKHTYPTLNAALAALLDPNLVAIGPRRASDPSPRPDPYVSTRRPTYLLQAHTQLAQGPDDVFAFFCRAENLGLMTPMGMAMQIVGQPPADMAVGTQICYTLHVGPLPLRWRTRISAWEPGSLFVDAQLGGPYRAWWHEHVFVEKNGGTRMTDRVFYAPPLGFLGRIAHALIIRNQLQQIFWYRASAIQLRFA